MGETLPSTNFFLRKKMLFTYLQFMYWASFSFLPYDVVFMRERGLSNTTVGLILSINSFIAIFGQPFWGFISDWIKSTKKVFMFNFGVCAALYIFLPFMHSAWSIGALLGVAMIFRSSAGSLLDNWIVASANQDKNISYGAIRMWGSIGFAIVVFIYGRITEGRSVTIIYPIYFVLAMITLVLCYFVKQDGQGSSSKRLNIREMKPRKLFSNYYYVVFIVFIFFINIPNGPGQNFIPNLLEKAGGTREQYGMMMSIKAFFEVPFFMFGRSLLNRLGALKLVIIGACIYMIEQFLFASATSPIQVILAQTLQGPSFSLYLLGMLHYIYDLAPGDLKATAQTLAGALGAGLSAIIGNYGGGVFIDHFGLQEMYWVGGISDIVAITLFILSFVIARKVVKARKTEYIE